jgi:hypothetical protein
MTDVTFLLRRGSAIEWLADPVLKQGEPGFDVTTGVLKLGDGISPWSVLRSHTPALKPNGAIALGAGAGAALQSVDSIAIGTLAGTGQPGLPNTLSPNAISIGTGAGVGNTESPNTISIGTGAGFDLSGDAIAIGRNAGSSNSNNIKSISIGNDSGTSNNSSSGDANEAVSIGHAAGKNVLGNYSIAIGSRADCDDNSITLNATGVTLSTNAPGSFTVAPIRNADSSYVMNYNPTTYEVSYSQKLGSSSGIDAYTIVEQGLTNSLSATIVGSGSVTFDISELLPTIRTFPLFTYPSDIGYTGPGGNAFQFNAYWTANSNDASVMTSGYLRFTLRSGDTSGGSLSRTIYDIADLNKKAIAFNDELDNTYEIKFQYILSEADETILQLVMDWVDIDVSTEITVRGVILVPFAYQTIVPTK